MMKLFALAAALLLQPLAVLADIPAHCLASDVLGTWTISFSAPVVKEDVMLSCDAKIDSTLGTQDITLSAETKAVSGDDKGFWTMVCVNPHPPSSRPLDLFLLLIPSLPSYHPLTLRPPRPLLPYNSHPLSPTAHTP